MAIAYSTVSCVFLVTLFANIKILEHAGVNAFIIVRSCTPFAVRAPLHTLPTPSAIHHSLGPSPKGPLVSTGQLSVELCTVAFVRRSPSPSRLPPEIQTPALRCLHPRPPENSEPTDGVYII